MDKTTINKDTEEIRRERLKKLREIGIDPYPHSSDRQQTNKEAKGMMDEQVVVVGRIMSKRGHGKLVFFDLVDETDKIQVFISQKIVGEEQFNLIDLLDIGDFIEASGKIFKTVAGEISVQCSSIKVLSKALRPLPSTWYGLKDVEERYRKRYLDFIVNPESKKVIELRSKIVAEVRKILSEKGFLEIETPTLQSIYGGANARPFKTYYNTLKEDFYLKISDELYLKRLIIGGFEKVFEIDHNFRNEGIDATHNPEFTMMECYWAYADYNQIMELTEELYSKVSMNVLGTTKVEYNGFNIDLKTPWERLTISEAIKKYLGFDIEKLNDEELKQKAIKLKVQVGKRGSLFNGGLTIASIFELVEEKLIGPVFITDFPKETTSLCKLHRNNPELIERFEPYIGGKEIGNAYTELNDPDLQRHFFEEEVKSKAEGNDETHPLDEDFLTAMEYGMPPTGGLGLGIDRMVMIMTGTHSIRNVIAFPTLKNRKD
ncbi:MAG: lysine--tRNA ligase [Patescibacteria group bacterium]|nr:lysine--tRNA ligase [Patescibacteria group bacterium]